MGSRNFPVVNTSELIAIYHSYYPGIDAQENTCGACGGGGGLGEILMNIEAERKSSTECLQIKQYNMQQWEAMQKEKIVN